MLRCLRSNAFSVIQVGNRCSTSLAFPWVSHYVEELLRTSEAALYSRSRFEPDPVRMQLNVSPGQQQGRRPNHSIQLDALLNSVVGPTQLVLVCALCAQIRLIAWPFLQTNNANLSRESVIFTANVAHYDILLRPSPPCRESRPTRQPGIYHAPPPPQNPQRTDWNNCTHASSLSLWTEADRHGWQSLLHAQSCCVSNASPEAGLTETKLLQVFHSLPHRPAVYCTSTTSTI